MVARPTDVLTSFAIDDNSIIGFTGPAIQKTNNEGIATVEVREKRWGNISYCKSNCRKRNRGR